MFRAESRVYAVVALLLLAPVAGALGDGAGARAEPVGAESAPSQFLAGRPEMARVYVELERMVMERAGTMPVQMLRRVNVGMDSGLNAYFLGDYSGSIRNLSAEIAAIEPGGDATARALAVRVDPRVVRPGNRIKARVGMMYPPRGVDSAALDLSVGVFAFEVGENRLSEALPGQILREKASLAMPREWEFPVPEGKRRVRVLAGVGIATAGEGPGSDGGRVFVSEQSLDEVREELLGRLERVSREHAELGAAIGACRWRASALSDRFAVEGSYLFSVDMLEFAEAVRGEVAALEGGKDPYREKYADLWLVLRVGEVEVPARLLAAPPRNVGEARPLIIAVHGAGGDENLWMDGYGAGVLKDVAIERHAVVASVRIVPGIFTPAMFDGIVEAVAKWQTIDRSRVYVIGHSMGGGVATTWAKLRADKIAAACSIAGVGSFTGSKKMAPMLAVAGELDGLIRADGVRASAAAARATGLDVEFREIKNYGHVLVAGRVTREAVEWMMGRGKAEGGGGK